MAALCMQSLKPLNSFGLWLPVTITLHRTKDGGLEVMRVRVNRGGNRFGLAEMIAERERLLGQITACGGAVQALDMLLEQIK